MRITIIVEELTHKVLAGFLNNFVVRVLGHSLDVLLDVGIDTFAPIPGIADFDWVTMVAKMNARSLSGIVVVDAKDFGNAWCNAPGRFIANLAH